MTEEARHNASRPGLLGFVPRPNLISTALLVWIVTKVVRTKSRRLQLGNSPSSFMAALGLNPSNGGTGAKRSDARRLREQMERLFRAIIGFDYSLKGEGRKGKAWMDVQVAPKGVPWWDGDASDEDGLWGSWIEVREDFYNAIMYGPTPLDVRILKHVKHSSMAIGPHTILNREAFRANKAGRAKFLAWSWLHAQIGNECGALDDFRRAALPQLKALLEVHSGLIVSQQMGRLRKSCSWRPAFVENPALQHRPNRWASKKPVLSAAEGTLAHTAPAFYPEVWWGLQSRPG